MSGPTHAAIDGHKFRTLASPVLGRSGAERVRDLVLSLEDLPDVSALVDLLRA